MSLKSQIEQEIKEAMLQRQKDRLRALRAVKAAILMAETEKGATHELTGEAEMKILQKAVKQRKDSLALYDQQGRKDLATVEQEEISVIEEFLPQQMTEEEVEKALKEIIKESGAGGPKDMGKVMGIASKKFAGQAEGKVISTVAKRLLVE